MKGEREEQQKKQEPPTAICGTSRPLGLGGYGRVGGGLSMETLDRETLEAQEAATTEGGLAPLETLGRTERREDKKDPEASVACPVLAAGEAAGAWGAQEARRRS